MAGLWYRAGTVSVTNGSKKVTGFGTKWKTSVSKPDKGHTVWAPDGKAYELDYVESDTVLWLVSSYSGTTAADQHYAIDISRSGSNSAFSRDLSAFVAYHQLQMDGWQQLLTGTGDVTLTAPDGTKLTVPSWEKIMNAGTGVVALAKAEADRAKSEASKAAASATAAGDVVTASALPLPDVWAPLSDSLRLITGYGRDVLVGSDVVARMVNFSRNSTASYKGKGEQQKSAAVNEPRFEREGLLNEMQSTNLWQSQDGAWVSVSNAPLESVTLPTGVTGNAYKVTPKSTGFAYVRAVFAQQTGQLTLSCFARRADGSNEMPTIYAGHSGAMDIKASGFYFGAGWWRMYAVMTSPVGNTGFGFASTTNDVIPVHVCFFQMEALPFATSYIPTSGAAVTRAADAAYLPAAGNRFASQGFTVAFEWDLLAVSDRIEDNRLIDFDNDASLNRHYVGVSQGRSLVAMFGTNKIVSQSAVMSGICVLVVSGPSFSLYNNGSKIGTATVTGIAEAAQAKLYLLCNNTGLFQSAGHMRNLRIWHRALSEEQIKAIK